jgi:hypothetical protein
MKKISLLVMIFGLIGLVGCQSTDSANSVYQKCIDKFEQQRERNGGNGGFVDPKRFCQSQKTSDKEEGKEYIISFKVKIDQNIIIQAGGTIEEILEPLNAVKSILTDREVEALKKSDAIKFIEENKEMKIAI